MIFLQDVMTASDLGPQQILQESRFIDTDLGEPLGDSRNSTVHLFDQVASGSQPLPTSHVAHLGEKTGDIVNPGFQRLARDSPSSFSEKLLAADFEHFIDRVLSMAGPQPDQHVDRQSGVVSRELLVAFIGQVVEQGRPARLSLLTLGRDQMLTLKDRQLPANSHRREIEFMADLLDGKRISGLLQGDENSV